MITDRTEAGSMSLARMVLKQVGNFGITFVASLIAVLAALMWWSQGANVGEFHTQSVVQNSALKPLAIEDSSLLVLKVKLNSGRFIAILGGETICDLSGSTKPEETYFRVLSAGISALQLTAWDHGNNKYDADVELAIAKSGAVETLRGPFSWVNPEDRPSGKLDGITLYLEVRIAKPSLSNLGGPK
jgi:hypothetical protein